jgi:hypothetical protein
MESKVVTPKKEESKNSSNGESKGSSKENLKQSEIHKEAAKNHQEAAKNHLDAAKFHEAGEHEKASSSTVKAHGFASLASDASREDAQNHASNS